MTCPCGSAPPWRSILPRCFRPDSCAASADCLEQRRDVFESHGVFSPAAIDGTLNELRSYGDRTLRADLADKPREIAALVERFFHCG